MLLYVITETQDLRAGKGFRERVQLPLLLRREQSPFGFSDQFQCPAQDSSSPARGWRWLSPVAGSEAPRRAAVVSLPVLVTVASADFLV